MTLFLNKLFFLTLEIILVVERSQNTVFYNIDLVENVQTELIIDPVVDR